MINTFSKCRLKPRHVSVGLYKKFFIVILAVLVPQEVLQICALAVQCALQRGLVSSDSRRAWSVSEHDSHQGEVRCL